MLAGAALYKSGAEMSEDQQTGEQADGEGSGAEISLNISHQYVKDLSFRARCTDAVYRAAERGAKYQNRLCRRRATTFG